ncbi:MAG: hypothetical protein OEM82_11670 [Acidobacteriota bacterium]|nr:hypothetical protein [Acidobacteriota bacterium]MDH3530154.1 hypothetical protein [Acidobacteriota bacterium]
MKISKLGIFVLVSLVAVLTGSCSFYNRIMARKALVDGAKAYNERNFADAEELFQKAVGYDSDLTTFEGKTAQLFLARTIHSEFAGDRGKPQLAERAIVEYKKTLSGFLADVTEKRAALEANPESEQAKMELDQSEKTVGSVVSAVASLYENLQQSDKWKEWQTTQAKNNNLPASARANAYIALAAKDYNCANDISDDDAVKKTVQKDGESAFQFSKPENEEDFEKLKKCVAAGTSYIDEAIKLAPESDSAWSYRTSLLVQQARIAEMDGDSEAMEKYKKESDEAKKKFEALAEKRRKEEEAAAQKAAEEKAKELGGSAPKADAEGEETPE